MIARNSAFIVGFPIIAIGWSAIFYPNRRKYVNSSWINPGRNLLTTHNKLWLWEFRFLTSSCFFEGINQNRPPGSLSTHRVDCTDRGNLFWIDPLVPLLFAIYMESENLGFSRVDWFSSRFNTCLSHFPPGILRKIRLILSIYFSNQW